MVAKRAVAKLGKTEMLAKRLINPTDQLQALNCGDIDTRQSFGPFLAVRGRGYLLDCSTQFGRPTLGFNASPLFGTTHHEGAWRDLFEDASPSDHTPLKTALLNLGNRTQAELAGQLNPTALGRLSKTFQKSRPTLQEISQTYITLSVLEQYLPHIHFISQFLRQKLAAMAGKFPSTVAGFKIDGLQVVLEFYNAEELQRIYADRFDYGLNFEIIGARKARFELVMAFRESDLSMLCLQLERLLRGQQKPILTLPDTKISKPDSVEQNYQFAEYMLRSRLSPSAHPSDETARHKTLEFVASSLRTRHDPIPLEPVILDKRSYPQHREQILEMQTEVYEPVRQTSVSEFDAIFESAEPLALLVMAGDQIAGMGLAGPLSLFPDTRGNATDPFRLDPKTLYMVDVTVRETFRGGLGKLIKQAVILLAQQRGFNAVHGRNRDRLARGMWSINLSMGSYELQHLIDDYPDQKEFRDCIYYRCPLAWSNLNSTAAENIGLFTEMHKRLPFLVNGQPD